MRSVAVRVAASVDPGGNWIAMTVRDVSSSGTNVVGRSEMLQIEKTKNARPAVSVRYWCFTLVRRNVM